MQYAYFLAEKSFYAVGGEPAADIQYVPVLSAEASTEEYNAALGEAQHLYSYWAGLGLDAHSRYDGVSYLPATKDRPAVYRITARDIFSEAFKVVTIDLPVQVACEPKHQQDEQQQSDG